MLKVTGELVRWCKGLPSEYVSVLNQCLLSFPQPFKIETLLMREEGKLSLPVPWLCWQVENFETNQRSNKSTSRGYRIPFWQRRIIPVFTAPVLFALIYSIKKNKQTKNKRRSFNIFKTVTCCASKPWLTLCFHFHFFFCFFEGFYFVVDFYLFFFLKRGFW